MVMRTRAAGGQTHGQLGWWIGAALAVIVLDQGVKRLVVRGLVEQGTGRIELGAPWLGLVYVENRGAAFGILQGHSWLFLGLASLMVCAIGVFAYWERAQPWYWQAALGLVAGGAVGNIVDRIRLGYVIDYVMIGPWPKFNVADAAIAAGLALLAFLIVRAEPVREIASPTRRLESERG